jgi:predicted Zn-dependent protease
MFAAARRDVTGDRLCRARGAEPASQTLTDGAIRAWARVAEDELRLDESELRLRELVKQRPTIANRKAFVAYLERNGFVAEAVTEVEAWKKAAPEDGSLSSKLVALLERKVRGDLLDKRADAAESAARRVLELDPKRAAMRYFLADALELKGNKTGADAERALAKAAGAEKPPAPDTFPGMVAPGPDGKPGQPGQKPPPGTGHGHDGHDHGHDHDH